MISKYVVAFGMVIIACSLLMGGYYFGLGQASELEEVKLSLRGINLSGGEYNSFLDSSLRYLLIGACVATSYLVYRSKRKLVIAVLNLPIIIFAILQSLFMLRNKTDPAISVGSALLRQSIIVFWYVDFLVPISLLGLFALYIFFLLRGPSSDDGFPQNRGWLRSYFWCVPC